jgi:thymidylate synthase
MDVPQYKTFQAAYLAHLAKVRDEPEFANAPRGNTSREILGVAYRLADPRERAIRLPTRRSNIVFNFAEALWYLSGSSSLEFISAYAPSMRKYSADGRTLRGTAYGPRIFHAGGAGYNQWDSVIRTLTEDPDSKRAVIQIFAPEELLIPANIDVACTVALQYVKREGRLHAITFMRANDAYRGTASDVFSFTFLQEMLATQLHLELGSYTHVAGSYHLYEPDNAAADRVLVDTATVSDQPFPAMPMGDNWPAVHQVLELEHAIRTGRLRLSARDLDRFGLPSYWTDIVALFQLHALWKADHAMDPDLTAAIAPLYAALDTNCRHSQLAVAT